MITFSCRDCGQKLVMPESSAGKRGKCPKCKNVVIVPDSQMVADLLAPGPAVDAEEEREKSRLNLTFLDVQAKGELTVEAPEPAEEYDESVSDYSYTDAPLLGYRRSEPEPVPQRKLPWIIDIFLYPTSRLGLTLLVIVTVTPILVRIVLLGSGGFILILNWFGWIIVISVYVYAFWYFSASVRQSAEGQLRATNAVMDTPGFGEMLWELFRGIVCLFFFFLPMIIYFGRTQKTDVMFWVLFGFGISMFPMGLLAITVLESFTGLNPVFLAGSILSTIFPYCLLVGIYFGLGYLLSLIGPMWKVSRENAYVCIGGFTYLLLVAGHLLGRFYFRYQDKLNWDA